MKPPTPHAMDPQLQTILRLYGEAEAAPEAASDPDAAALAEARFWMDHRPRVRPDAAVLEAIFAAAAPPTHTRPGQRADRAPVARRRTLRRAAALVAVSLSVVVALVVVPFTSSPVPDAAPGVAAEYVAPLPVADLPEAVSTEEVLAVPTQAAPAPPAALAWDSDRAALDALERKTAELRARLDSTLWDAPGADLRLGTSGPGVFTQAGNRRAQ